MVIKEFESTYRDDLIFMVLQAKDALGRKPGLNEDLLDIHKNYFEKDDKFWIAVDDNDRVIGSIGYSIEVGKNEAVIHRLFVKANMKRNGIGSKLLETAEKDLQKRGIDVAKVNLGAPKEQWAESYAFYPKHGYVEYAARYMMKELEKF